MLVLKQKRKLVVFLSVVLCLGGVGVYAQSGPWLRHTIDSSSTGADGVKLADINGDGLPDIVTGWEEGNLTRLYLHPGKAHVKAPWPAVTVGATPSVEDAVFADLDGDGRLEILSCAEKGSEKILVHWAPPE
ncbi:MAG: VCBS repeat-containing protein, partial [Bacteroidetes bacterium]|nr:VCBS repeat-containing protein [Bacteroidota bacterium]